MVALATALENQTCETCGCTPCDCDQREPPPAFSAEVFEILTTEEKKCDGLAALILRRKQRFPNEMRDASAAEVRKYLKAS